MFLKNYVSDLTSFELPMVAGKKIPYNKFNIFNDDVQKC